MQIQHQLLSEKLKVLFIVFGVWAFATFWNINKAFHIDDIYYLDIARWIKDHPWHPMIGLVYYSDLFIPIHEVNQPHFYFYLMALWEYFFDISEIAIHSLMAIFTLWAIYGVMRLSRLLIPKHYLLATVFFGLGPAFVINQNTMVDVPMIAIWIEFYYQLVKPTKNDWLKYVFLGILCGVAILIKYTSLVLVPAIILEVVIRKKYKNLLWIILPLGIVVGWSIFNFFDYGGIHLLGRGLTDHDVFAYVRQSIWFIGVLGAICPCALMFFALAARQSQHPKRWLLLFCMSCISYFLVILSILYSPGDNTSDLIFNLSFLFCGFGLIGLLWKGWSHRIFRWHEDPTEVILSYWILSTFCFVVFLAPFIASRHILLITPPVIILIFRWGVQSPIKRYFVHLSVLLTLLITSLLASADYWYANIYRVAAKQIVQKIPPHSNIWFTGPWGWQWYATQAGMKPFDIRQSHPEPGDYLVTVKHSSKLKCAQLKEIEVLPIERENWYQRFAAINFYTSDMRPWEYSTDPIETFTIYQFNDKLECPNGS